jgi:membrane protein required for colicin V production
MIVLDLILLIPILIGTWLGFRNGFIITITTLLAFIGGTYAGLWFSETVSGFIQSMMSSPHPYVPLISFSICFLAVCALVFFIGKWAQRLSKIVLLGALDKIAGGIFGLLQTTLLVAIALMVIDSFLFQNNPQAATWKEQSLLYTPLTSLADYLVPSLKEHLNLIHQLKEIQG